MVSAMNLTVFVISLAVGGLIVGALFGTLLPRIAGGRLWPIWSCIFFTVIGGFLVTDFFEAEYSITLPMVLALSPLWLLWASRSSGGGGLSTGSWGGDSGSGDCGGGDSGGGGGCD
jgi:uncharacterized membrane protein YgcG